MKKIMINKPSQRQLAQVSTLWLSAAVACLGSISIHAQTALQIDFAQAHQEIDSFGASDAWSINPTIKKWVGEGKEDDVEKLADLLFSTDSGIGLSAWRFNIGAGSTEQGTNSKISDHYRRAELFIAAPGGTVDTTKQAGQVRLLKEAYERGVTNYVAFANSPPTWATKNGLAHPGDGINIGSTNLKADQVENFSKFLASVVGYLRNSVGVPVNYLSPINEPTWEWNGQSQEANRYNNTDAKAVYRGVATALKEQGLDGAVSVDGVEAVEYTAALDDSYKMQFDNNLYSGGMNNKGSGTYKNYIGDFLGDAELKAIFHNRISMHGYWSDSWPDRLGQLRDITFQNVKAVSPDAKIWMSEYSILGDATDARPFAGSGFNADDMVFALHTAKVIHRDLTRLNASAWHWWLAVTPYNYKDGLIKINSTLDASTLKPSKMMWAVGNFSRFIRPGYVRVELPNVDDLNGVLASAYKSADDKKLVIVAINASAQTKDISVNLANLPSGAVANAFDVYITNATKSLEKVGSANGSYTIPASSIVTLVSDVGEPHSSSSSSDASSSSSSTSTSSSSSSMSTSSSSSSSKSSSNASSSSPAKKSGSGSLDFALLCGLVLFTLFSRVLRVFRAKV